MLGERIASRLTVLRLICDQVVPQVLACAVESSVILLTLSLHHYIDAPTKGRGGCSRTAEVSSTARRAVRDGQLVVPAVLLGVDVVLGPPPVVHLELPTSLLSELKGTQPEVIRAIRCPGSALHHNVIPS